LQQDSGQLLALFQRLLAPSWLEQVLAEGEVSFYERLFSPLITLWYLLFQRWQADHTLEHVVDDVHDGGADGLNPSPKPLSQRIRSWATTAYSDARQRLPLGVLTKGLVEQGRQVRQLVKGLEWRGLRVSLLDGSTLRLRPHPAIRKEFKPHRNHLQAPRKKKPRHPPRRPRKPQRWSRRPKTKPAPGHPAYWCLLRVVVRFCARTGAVLGGATGATSVSEQSLAVQLLWQASALELFVGDRNFGIFRIVQVARQVGAHALLRLTEVRARKLVAGPLRAGREYAVAWAPTRHDQQEPDCESRAVAGRLLVARVHRPGFRAEMLYLFTTLTDAQDYPMEALVDLYGVRWSVELNLRYLKSEMDLAQLESKSPAMVQKEWLAGLMAYNLIRAVMVVAALEAGIEPLELSFSGARRQLERFLKRWAAGEPDLPQAWAKLLEGVARRRLPKRSKPRPSEPRAVRHVRMSYKPLWGSRAKARRCCSKYQNKS
jgi:hypothetical protein